MMYDSCSAPTPCEINYWLALAMLAIGFLGGAVIMAAAAIAKKEQPNE